VPFAGLVALVSGLAVLASASLGLWDAVTVLAAGGLILGLGSLDNARAGVLGSKLGVYLGEISYSIYMVCAPVLLLTTNVAARLTGADDKRFHIIVWLALVAAIPVVAMLTYHLVERPARKAMRGFADRRAAQAAAAKARTDSPERGLQPSETIV
jgi:peptidoglycan/LPS O-acetylase OafA/YrhL